MLWFSCRLCSQSGLRTVFDRSEFVLEHIQLTHPKAMRRRLRSGLSPDRILFRKYNGSAAGEEYPVGHSSPVVNTTPPLRPTPLRPSPSREKRSLSVARPLLPSITAIPPLMSLDGVGGPSLGSTSLSSGINLGKAVASEGPSSASSRTLVIDGVDGDNLRYHWVSIPNVATALPKVPEHQLEHILVCCLRHQAVPVRVPLLLLEGTRTGNAPV